LRAAWPLWGPLALPGVNAPGEELEFLAYKVGDPTVAGVWSIEEPRDRERVTPELLIIPCLGYHIGGKGRIFRIGYGKGYYDRTLAHRPMATIGVAYSRQESKEFLPEAHDIPLNHLINEDGTIEGK
jgi:5,10-methenyltetrahydrofolate synthetase